jgi:hypothetical protein
MKKRKISEKVLAILKRGREKRLKNLKSKSLKKSSKKGSYSKPIKEKRRTMAKKRRSIKKSSNQKSGMLANVSGIAGAVVYGAVRERVSDYIANTQIGKQLPATQFTDEAVMLAINFGARKLGLGKNPIGNSILRAQKTVELARVGQGISDMIATRNNKVSVNNSNGLIMLN